MVVLVMTTSAFPNKEEFVRDLLGKCPEITTLVLNVNKSTGSKIIGDEIETLYGNGYIQDDLAVFTSSFRRNRSIKPIR
jgi:23S rRNA (uracil1939-C5)-methyltransferase